jgi:hypothetical protein
VLRVKEKRNEKRDGDFSSDNGHYYESGLLLGLKKEGGWGVNLFPICECRLTI